MMSTDTVGVVIGRYQVDELHEGQRAILDQVCAFHSRVIVLLGINPTQANDYNPLSYELRRKMIKLEYPRVDIHPVTDNKSDILWSRGVDSIIGATIDSTKAILYSGRDSFVPHYKGKYPTRELSFIDEHLNSTEIREKIRDTYHDSRDFRAGVIHARMNGYDRTETTVDMAVVRRNPDDGHLEVLLGNKPGERTPRFPGGFVDGTEKVELAASREMREETGISIDTKSWRYVGNFDVKDWRLRGAKKHHLRTFFFVSNFTWGHPEGGDDLERVGWYKIEDRDFALVGEHEKLWESLEEWVDNNPDFFNQGALNNA